MELAQGEVALYLFSDCMSNNWLEPSETSSVLHGAGFEKLHILRLICWDI